jgi:Protein of unknown function (DUF3307).
MELILLGHLLGDFYFQTNHIATKKKQSNRYMQLHCLQYMIGIYLALIIITQHFVQGLIIAGIIGALHLLVDDVKIKADSKKPELEYFIFVIDQLVHIAILIITYLFIQPDTLAYSSWELYGIHFSKIIVIIVAWLTCWRPAAIFITLVFHRIPITVEVADREGTGCNGEEQKEQKEQKEQRESHPEQANMKEEVVKIGSWIGILEREIILLLGLLGQFGAIGFVLTAKSLARYKQLENKAFAEKYLIGTLLSALIAIGCVGFCSLIK